MPVSTAASPRPGLPAFLWPLIAALVIVPACYLWIDRPVALYFHAHANWELVKIAHAMTEIANPGIWLTGSGLLFLFWRFIRPNAVRAAQAGFIFLCDALGAGIAELLEKPLGRSRPALLFEHGDYAFAPLRFLHHFNSFPSDHAASAVAMGVAFGFLFPRWRWPLAALGLLIALTRVVITAHYLGDALTGAAIGTAMVLAIHAAFRQRGWLAA